MHQSGDDRADAPAPVLGGVEPVARSLVDAVVPVRGRDVLALQERRAVALAVDALERRERAPGTVAASHVLARHGRVRRSIPRYESCPNENSPRETKNPVEVEVTTNSKIMFTTKNGDQEPDTLIRC